MRSVAIKKGQGSGTMLGFQEMGTLRCEGCGEEFIVGHDPESADKDLAERRKLARKSPG
jgi:hypothetical protein